MSMISLIAIVDKKGGLGKENRLLCHLPADLKHFRQLTYGKPVIMGRHTYESIGKALPGRQNIVLSKQLIQLPDATIFSTLEEALKSVNQHAEIMIIGGAQVYQQALACADKIYLTVIDHSFDADVFFPKIDVTQWACIANERYAADANNPYDLSFQVYQRK